MKERAPACSSRRPVRLPASSITNGRVNLRRSSTTLVPTAVGSDASMKRGAVAFFIAPLAVPLLLLPWLSSGHLALGWMLTATVIAAMTGYVGTLVFGMPAYFFLRARGLTSAWIAVAIGFAIGALMWLVFS